MKRNIILIIILTSILFLSAFEQNIDTINREAIEEYQNKNYESALEKFTQIESQGVIDANLFYNIANCWFRQENLGKAILYYKKALRVNPRHSLAEKNLDFTLTLTRDKIETPDPGALQKMIKTLYHSFTINSLAITGLILFAILVFLLVIMQTVYRFRDKSLPVFFIFLVLIMLTATIITATMKFNAYHDDNNAVILAPTAVGFSGPGSEYTRVFTVHEGMTCRIEDKNDNWVLIKLPNGIGGWIESNLLEKVTL